LACPGTLIGIVRNPHAQPKKRKQPKEYKEGREAQENFETTMKALFRAPKVDSKKPKKKGKD
jgi:hypothetical protein